MKRLSVLHEKKAGIISIPLLQPFVCLVSENKAD